MKNYVVALLSFFDNDIKQFGIEAESPYEAVKKAMIENTSDKHKQFEIDYQNSEHYPTTFEEMEDYFANSDMTISVIEVGSLIK
jgi:hypothetical protein